MHFLRHVTPLFLALFALAACSSTEVSQRQVNTREYLPRPGRILVYDFTAETAAVVRGFIEEFWNARDPEAAARYLAEDYLDHDNRTTLQGVEALRQWLTQTSATFDHRTVIEDQVTEGDRSITVRWSKVALVWVNHCHF